MKVRVVMMVLVIALIAATCGGSDDSSSSSEANDTTPPTEANDTTPPTEANDTTPPTEANDTTPPTEANGTITTMAEMCARLAELEDKGLSPEDAYVVIRRENLKGLSGAQLGRFADLLLAATNDECPTHFSFALGIHYWVL